MAAWHLSQGNAVYAAIAAIGCLSGILISPDLDMAGRTISESLLIRWNILLGRLWVVLWFPYAMLSKHRGLSHVPVFGTIGRVLYLSAYYYAAHLLLHYYYAMDLLSWPQLYWYELLIFAVGLTISDIGHWILDGCRL
jgi:uncharacterized metal-binding protein